MSQGVGAGACAPAVHEGRADMARIAHDTILMALADELKAKAPDTLTAEERDYIAKWDAYAKRKGLT